MAHINDLMVSYFGGALGVGDGLTDVSMPKAGLYVWTGTAWNKKYTALGISDPTSGAVMDGTAMYVGTGAPDATNPLTRLRTPNIFKSFNAQLVTAETTIWTPAAGKKFRLMGFHLTQGVVTGALTVRDGTAGATILTIPQNTIGVAMAGGLGNGIVSAAANNLLTIQGAATETISGYFYGNED